MKVARPEAQTALSRAKIALMTKKDSAFFTTLCFSMKHVWNDTIPTADCDGKTIRWSPTFFMDRLVDQEERVFLMLHETLHAAYMHMDPARVGKKDPKRWNIACDHVINLQLMARGFKMPTKVPGHADQRFAGMGAEAVYKILDEEKSQDEPGMSDLVADVFANPAEAAKLQRHIEDILVRAQMQSKIAGDKPGTIPGEIEVFLDKLLNPKLPWHVILRRWFRDNFAKIDYSWRKPNRRFFPEHHLPSLWSEAVMDFASFCDISGSVSDEMFHRYVTETHSAMKTYKPGKIYFGQFDTSIKQVDVLRDPRDLLKVNFHGRGGTHIQCVLDWLNENKPKGALVFSDGGFHFDDSMHCDVPIVWLVHDNPTWTAPFGRVIHFEMD